MMETGHQGPPDAIGLVNQIVRDGVLAGASEVILTAGQDAGAETISRTTHTHAKTGTPRGQQYSDNVETER